MRLFDESDEEIFFSYLLNVVTMEIEW